MFLPEEGEKLGGGRRGQAKAVQGGEMFQSRHDMGLVGEHYRLDGPFAELRALLLLGDGGADQAAGPEASASGRRGSSLAAARVLLEQDRALFDWQLKIQYFLVKAVHLDERCMVECILSQPEEKVRALKIDQEDVGGWTILCTAVKLGRIEIVKMLLRHPFVDVNHATLNNLCCLDCGCYSASECGLTPLHIAVRWLEGEQLSSMLAILLSRQDIDIYKGDELGSTPSFLANSLGKHDAVAQLGRAAIQLENRRSNC